MTNFLLNQTTNERFGYQSKAKRVNRKTFDDIQENLQENLRNVIFSKNS